jgi:Skp family chaperone for outer membrane proteins
VPLNEKILKAIDVVAKAKGFTHITDRKNFYFASPSFDVTKQVTEEANK